MDTSAVVKRYIVETGTDWVETLVDPANNNTIILSEITLAEFAAAVSIKLRMRIITAIERTTVTNLFLNHCDTEYELTSVDRSLIRKAVDLAQTHFLRGYDAVQLATALIARDTLSGQGITDYTFVSADNSLIAAAMAEGLTAENPNTYP
jgi:predicted nucleic acid-binding protein